MGRGAAGLIYAVVTGALYLIGIDGGQSGVGGVGGGVGGVGGGDGLRRPSIDHARPWMHPLPCLTAIFARGLYIRAACAFTNGKAAWDMSRVIIGDIWFLRP